MAAGEFLGTDISNAGRPGMPQPSQSSAWATVEIIGLNAVMMQLKRVPVISRQIMASCMTVEMQDVITLAKTTFVPVDSGETKDSGRVTKAKFDKNEVTVDGVFGPVKNIRGSLYTIPLHEIPEKPATSVGGYSASHQHGSWKFLQIPFLMRMGGMLPRIQARFNVMMSIMRP